MRVFITGSKKNEHDEISVFFANEQTDDWYYAHGIRGIGAESNPDSFMHTAWSWVNHMRHKRWWNPLLEADFFEEVEKYFYGS